MTTKTLLLVLVIGLSGLLLVTLGLYGYRYSRAYNRLMDYLKHHHPDIYEQIRVRPDWGPFYSKGNVYKRSVEYARNHPPLGDPIAEKLLANYAHIAGPGTVTFTVIIGVLVLAIFVLWSAYNTMI